MIDLFGIKKQTARYNAQALQLQKITFGMKAYRLATEFVMARHEPNAMEKMFIAGMTLVNFIKEGKRKFGGKAQVYWPNGGVNRSVNVMNELIKKGKGHAVEPIFQKRKL